MNNKLSLLKSMASSLEKLDIDYNQYDFYEKKEIDLLLVVILKYFPIGT